MIEDIEELRLQSQGELFAKKNSFCQIHVGPDEFRTTELVPAGVAKLAVGRIVPTETSAGSGICCGHESIRVQPLHRSELRDTGNVAVTAVGIRPWHKSCELRTAALDDAISIEPHWITLICSWKNAVSLAGSVVDIIGQGCMGMSGRTYDPSPDQQEMIAFIRRLSIRGSFRRMLTWN